MKNIDFIKQYGKREFIDMCKFVPMQLSIAKHKEKLGVLRSIIQRNMLNFTERIKRV